MQICVIVAKSTNNIIGNGNQLLWRLPADLAYFKKITVGYPIIMGRKTFESIGRPLPKRVNVIISRNKDYQAEGCLLFDDWKDSITYFRNRNTKKVFIIGGGQIYNLIVPIATQLFVTEVHIEIEGDTSFPVIDKNVWKEKSRESHKADDKNSLNYDFVTYSRIEPSE